MTAEACTSPRLERAGFRHAFFTRNGGVSEGPYASLSFSLAAGDHPAHVAENLRRASRVLGVDDGKILYLSQVHGKEVRRLVPTDSLERTLLREGDACFSDAPGLACGVRVADCVPILVGDQRTGAVAAIHAGWRGAVLGVVGEAVEALVQIGSRAADLVAAIGPHISLEAFEIGEEVARELEAAGCRIDRVRFDKPHADLRGLVAAELHRAGVSDVDHVEGCTLSDPARFFSYRRDGKESGRHLAAIAVRV